MQHVVHNRATIRVADRTDESGRVTADEVNLDRFHNRIRKVCASGRTWLALVTASMGLYLVLPDRGLAQNNQGQNNQGIKPGVPNGTYSLRTTGYVPPLPGSSGLSGGLVPLAAAGRITFFANGTTSGVVSASVGGVIVDPIMINGSWTVNPDGSVSETEQQTLANGVPGLLLHFKDYATLDGNTITFVGVDPGSTTGGIDTR
jgi:hypothetical protein